MSNDQAKWLKNPKIPSLTLGLRHNLNQSRDPTTGKHIALFSAPANDRSLIEMSGVDLGADLHRGYQWWMVRDRPHEDPNAWKLPPGIALGFKHSQMRTHTKITVFGRDPVSGPAKFAGFRKEGGYDLGAPSGQGFFWYESTGDGFRDWGSVDLLPRWTILGLKYSSTQRNQKVYWMGKTYDPADPNIQPPPGFVRCFGGDQRDGRPSGHGYYWYEKVTGPEVVFKPELKVRLDRSLLWSEIDGYESDRDRDGLIDTLEGQLAYAFRPYVIFDSDECAREPHEPVTLFQVRPINLKGDLKRILIRWVFLFIRDGGYGPNSDCSNSHPGDNDDATYELESRDNGLTWQIVRVSVSYKGIEWPKNSRLEVYDLRHPIIYMSASKHHEYLTKDNDHKDSAYSGWGCNDDVNGQGARFLVNIRSVEKGTDYYNNVGEPESHPSPPFVNNLQPYFPDDQGRFYSAWDSRNFYDEECPPMRNKWKTNRFEIPLEQKGSGVELIYCALD